MEREGATRLVGESLGVVRKEDQFAIRLEKEVGT
jgi:hypothetical protein